MYYNSRNSRPFPVYGDVIDYSYPEEVGTSKKIIQWYNKLSRIESKLKF